MTDAICMACLDKEAAFTHQQFVVRRDETEDAVFNWSEPLCFDCAYDRFRRAIETGRMEWSYDDQLESFEPGRTEGPGNSA